ncbi:hypothetical protein AGLY_012231 [Aphis glycines]|uniref:Uncharacterized protein n=1 Tax=Aphis glycines TaxID=307491 RepID=A0A6G0T9N0_APHGL|nr:hypothetical protein AGLY_012231 [Aphis glycines]
MKVQVNNFIDECQATLMPEASLPLNIPYLGRLYRRAFSCWKKPMRYSTSNPILEIMRLILAFYKTHSSQGKATDMVKTIDLYNVIDYKDVGYHIGLLELGLNTVFLDNNLSSTSIVNNKLNHYKENIILITTSYNLILNNEKYLNIVLLKTKIIIDNNSLYDINNNNVSYELNFFIFGYKNNNIIIFQVRKSIILLLFNNLYTWALDKDGFNCNYWIILINNAIISMILVIIKFLLYYTLYCSVHEINKSRTQKCNNQLLKLYILGSLNNEHMHLMLKNINLKRLHFLDQTSNTYVIPSKWFKSLAIWRASCNISLRSESLLSSSPNKPSNENPKIIDFVAFGLFNRDVFKNLLLKYRFFIDTEYKTYCPVKYCTVNCNKRCNQITHNTLMSNII